jgi:hypothetical protein
MVTVRMRENDKVETFESIKCGEAIPSWTFGVCPAVDKKGQTIPLDVPGITADFTTAT